MLFSYLKYLLKAKNAHKIHSPFVYEWYHEHFDSSKNYYALNEIIDLRKSLAQDKNLIEISILGAGRKKKSKHRIHQLLRQNSIPHKYGRILFELANHLKANHILEIGTCLGISTLYMAKARPKAKIFTLEGHGPYAHFAKKLFQTHSLHQVHVIEGLFEDTLPIVLNSIPKLDMVFFDGNHCYHATIQYFHSCLQKKHDESVFIFDDIYWSKGMQKAWSEIKSHPEVSLTFDFFRIGVVFFRKGIVKQDFVLRY